MHRKLHRLSEPLRDIGQCLKFAGNIWKVFCNAGSASPGSWRGQGRRRRGRQVPQWSHHGRYRHRNPGHARYAALLTPQGKIIVDFIVAAAAPADGGGYFLDFRVRSHRRWCSGSISIELRAKVVVEDLSDVLGVLAAWGGSAPDQVWPLLCGSAARRARPALHAAAASRRASHRGSRRAAVDAADYEAHRIALGVPRGELDFAYGDAFPHEADMDQLHGVDFKKGCFVGQEVVSRMEHRGTVRARVVPIATTVRHLRQERR